MGPYEAQAVLCGSSRCPGLRGTVRFTPRDCGSVVQVCVTGLPCGCGCVGFHGFCVEGLRAGAMPPLLNANGTAIATFYTSGFRPEEAVGHNVQIFATAQNFERCCGTALGGGMIALCAPPALFPPPREDCGCWPTYRPPMPPLYPMPR